MLAAASLLVLAIPFGKYEVLPAAQAEPVALQLIAALEPGTSDPAV